MLGNIRSMRFVGIIHDTAMAGLALFFAYMTVYGLDRTLAVPSLMLRLAVFMLAATFVFFALSLNRGSWRYASLPDLFAIVKAAAILAVGYTLVLFLIERAQALPRSVPLLLAIFLVMLLGAPRLLYRIYREGSLLRLLRGWITRQDREWRNLLVYGVNDTAEQFIRTTRVFSRGEMRVVGLIDDRLGKRREQMHGVRGLGTSAELVAILAKLGRQGVVVDELVVAEHPIAPSKLTTLTELAIVNGLKISKLPEIGTRRQITSQDIFELQPLNLNDLLGRSEVTIDVMGVARFIQGRTIMITGAGGSIGSELARQVAMFNPKALILTDNSEYLLYRIHTQVRDSQPHLRTEGYILDVRDSRRCDSIVGEFKPDVIFHAAALKHVPIVEANPLEGLKTNVLGTVHIADAAKRHGVKTFVMISTDKAVNPTNVMGATKRAAEAYCQAIDLESESTHFKTVRFGNVLGSNGSVVPRFRDQIAKGGPVTVTHPEIVRYFMSIPEAVRLVLQASVHGMNSQSERGKILVLDMGEPVKIDDLARKMIYLAGFKPGVDIHIVYTGLRPGEKLYEELFAESEPVDSNNGRGYMIAGPRAINAGFLRKSLAEMRAACDRQDSEKAIAVLRHIVPEFRDSGAVPAQKGVQVLKAHFPDEMDDTLPS